MLSKKQLQAIGYAKCEDIPHYLWNKDMSHIFKKCENKKNFDQNQTYKQFIEMKLTGANQDGSGRYPFKTVKQIQLTFVLKEKTNQKQKISQKFTKAISQIVTSFFQIPTKFIPSYLYLTKKRMIVDQIQQIQYQPSHMKEKPYAFDVFSLFEVGFQSKQEQKNRLFLIQADLHEEQQDVDGRACGDGIAFITFYPAKSKKDQQKLLQFTLQTVIHQNLHTFGFDHCSAWNCLMNAYTNFQFWLCPCCLRKLSSQINKPVLQWYKEIVQKLKQFQMTEQFQKGTKIIESIIKKQEYMKMQIN